MLDADEEKKEAISITPNQIITIFKSIGNFIGFMSRKVIQHWSIAEIAGLGTVIRNNNNGTLDFIPNHNL